MSGYIKLYRQAWDSPEFEGDEFSRREAWFWLIAQAAWKPRQMRVGQYLVDVDRGQCAFSLRYLATAWGWTVKRVRTFLKAGTGSDRVRLETGTHWTIITICNYETFQSEEPAKGTMRAQRGHNEGTNKKKGRKEEGKKDPPVVPPEGGTKRATSIPDNWTLPDKGRDYAMGKGWTDEKIDDAAEHFAAHHGAKGSRFKDWNRAWVTWVLNDRKFRGAARNHVGDSDPYLDAARGVVARDKAGGFAGSASAPGGLLALHENRGDSPRQDTGGNVVALQPIRGSGDVRGHDHTPEPKQGYTGASQGADECVFAAAFRIPGGGSVGGS